MKCITLTCITPAGTQLWFKDDITKRTHFELVKTDPSQIRSVKAFEFPVEQQTNEKIIRIFPTII